MNINEIDFKISKSKDINGLVIKIFILIKSVDDIKELREKIEIDNFKFNYDRYPKIEYTIKPNEIDELIKKEIFILVDGSLKLNNNMLYDCLKDPLLKLFFAMAWKQGDLVKLKHIANGVLNSNNKIDDNKEALVFNNFGKHLAKPDSEPIIDQNILRVFSIYKSYEKEKTTFIISEYKKWLNELNVDIKNQKDYLYHIDIILFIIGKAIKQQQK